MPDRALFFLLAFWSGECSQRLDLSVTALVFGTAETIPHDFAMGYFVCCAQSCAPGFKRASANGLE